MLRWAPVRLALLLLLLLLLLLVPLCPLGRPLVTSVPVPPDYWTASIPVGGTVLGGPPPQQECAMQQCTSAARTFPKTLPEPGPPVLGRPRMVLDRRL